MRYGRVKEGRVGDETGRRERVKKEDGFFFHRSESSGKV